MQQSPLVYQGYLTTLANYTNEPSFPGQIYQLIKEHGGQWQKWPSQIKRLVTTFLMKKNFRSKQVVQFMTNALKWLSFTQSIDPNTNVPILNVREHLNLYKQTMNEVQTYIKDILNRPAGSNNSTIKRYQKGYYGQQKLAQQQVAINQFTQVLDKQQMAGQTGMYEKYQTSENSMGMANNPLNAYWKTWMYKPKQPGKELQFRQKPYFKVGDYFTPSNYQKTDLVAYQQALTGYRQTLKQNALNKTLMYFPQWRTQVQQNKQQQISLRDVVLKLQKRRADQNDTDFKQLATMDQNVKWDGGNKIWRLPKNIQSTLTNTIVKPNFQKVMQTNKWIAGHQLNQKQIQQYIPPIIATLVKSNQNFSRYGIGPKGDNSLPFYAGRWIDPTTGRIKLLPQASSKLLNPFKRKQRLGYLQAALLNKWNKFVQIQQQYLNLSQMTDQQFKQKQQKYIKTALNTQFQPKYVVQYWTHQIQLFNLGLLTSQATKKFLSFKPKNTITVAQQISKILTAKKLSSAQKYNTIIQIIASAYNNVPAIRYDTTQGQFKTIQQIRNTAISWLKRGKTAKINAIKKLSKGLIPSQLTQQQIISLKQRIQNTNQAAQNFVNKNIELKPVAVPIIQKINAGEYGQAMIALSKDDPLLNVLLPSQKKRIQDLKRQQQERLKLAPPKKIKTIPFKPFKV